MMLQVCSECFKTIPCKETCHGGTIEADELIVPVLIELRRKGYKTKSCCSGHWYGKTCTTYIYFEKGYDPKSAPKHMKWDEWDVDRLKPTIRIDTDYLKQFHEDRYNFIIKLNQLIYEWALSLPDNSE